MPPGLNKTKENDYNKNPKNNCIRTPRSFGKLIYGKIPWDVMANDKESTIILDIGCANGNLSWKYAESDYFKVYGIDIEDYSDSFNGTFIQDDFFKTKKETISSLKPNLVLCNPTWNNPKKLENCTPFELDKAKTKYELDKAKYEKTHNKSYDIEFDDDNYGKSKYGKAYFPELFLKKIFQMYGADVPIVILTSYTLIMNVRCQTRNAMIGGQTRQNWLRDCGAKITSVLEMPLDFFPGVKMWWHTLFFNLGNLLPPVWFLPDEYLTEYYIELQQNN